jgi:glycerol-3-phosphate dehydrogenase
LISIFGGKLTTYRLMAEEVVDLLAVRLGSHAACSTARTVLETMPHPKYHALPGRLRRAEGHHPPSLQAGILCECELVTQDALDHAIRQAASTDLDDVRRDTRLGMGPCQAAFCAYRAAGRLVALRPEAPADGGLRLFLEERWRGIRPLAWGQTLRQLELDRRVALELLGLPPQDKTSDA